jgi:hypothetical protein
MKTLIVNLTIKKIIMKTKIFISLISLFSVQLLMAQNENKVADAIKELNNDTIAYIKEKIVDKKSSYIGKSLEQLLKDLPTVTRYIPHVVENNRNISLGLTLYFTTAGRVLDQLEKKKDSPFVVITWATPSNNNDLIPLGLKIFGGEWTQVAYNYYKNKLIANIETLKSVVE